MTTAHNIVPAPGPAFVRPSGGGGPTVRTKPWPEWAMLRAEEVRAKLPPEQWGPWNHQGPCLVSNNTTGSSQMQPHPTEAPHFFYCRAHLQAIRARIPTVRPWPARDKGRCCSCGAAAEPLPVTMADPVACVEAERDQQHRRPPEHQALLRRMQPLPPPAVPRPDLPRDRSEAPGPTGRMLQYHQYQPAAPLCQMLRRGGGQSVCSGDAARAWPPPARRRP